MREKQDPALQGRRLRTALREARIRAGLTQQEAAVSLDWSRSKIRRIETGESHVSTPDLRALLDLYGVTDTATVSDLVSMARRSRWKPWDDYRDVLGRGFLTYLGFESSAATIREYESSVVPGLLQTEEYMRITLRAMSGSDFTAADIERRIQARQERQELLYREGGPNAHFIIDEAAVRRWVSPGSAVMPRQLEHIRRLAGRPNVSVQILPFAAGEHAGMAGPFIHLEFPGPTDADLVYLERGRNDLVERNSAHDTQRYLGFFRQLEAIALPAAGLDSFIDSLLAERNGDSR
jgi:transcriptional regulator with XRE-family HTH domain